MRHMPNLSKRLTSIFLVFVLAFILTGAPAAARTLDEINRDIENTQRTRDDLARQGKDVTAQLADVDKSIASIQIDISTLEDQLKLVQDAKTAAEADLLQLQAKLQSTENDLAEQSDVIDTRLSSIYKSGDLGYIEVILGAKSFDDFINRMDYLAMIVKSDKAVFDKISELKNEIQLARNTADAKKQEILSREGAILKIKQPLDYKKAELDQERGAKESLFNQIAGNKDYQDELIAELYAEQDRILNRSRGGGGGGPYASLIWPISSHYINCPWGYHDCSVHVNRPHTGIDLPDVIEGQTVVMAAAPGVVVWAGWGEGGDAAYGKYVQINHYDGKSTVYGHLYGGSSGIFVFAGQVVYQGQAIGTAGTTGNSTGPHLHFEVYDPSNPNQIRGTVNPLDYLP